ncbi:MAG TPA: CBS domain-containing protein [Pyrinomonadaceae bacterium]|jgi:CBS domain-containing protein|nr:CBS domain-containing protein [Pyrinomonadaceae bacterium]
MSRFRGDRDDEDFYGGERGARRRPDEGRYDEGGRGEYGRAEERGPEEEQRGYWRGYARPGYEYDERDAGRGRAGWGPRGEYDSYAEGRGDYYRDDYNAGRPRPEWRGGGGAETQHYRRAGERRGATRSHVRCRDIMTRDVTCATRETTLQEVARMMRDEDTGVIPVVEPGVTTSDSTTEVQRVPARTRSNGKLVGLITDRDIVVRALAEGRDAREVLAEEIMTTDIHTAQPNDRVIEAIRKMGDKQVRRIPIVDREGQLRGIISMADVALETEDDRELAEALEEISSGSSFWNRIFG